MVVEKLTSTLILSIGFFILDEVVPPSRNLVAFKHSTQFNSTNEIETKRDERAESN